MNKKDIEAMIGSIGDDFIQEAAVIRKKRSHILRNLGIAACFCLLFAVGVLVLNRQDTGIALPSDPAVSVSDSSVFHTENTTQPPEPTTDSANGNSDIMISATENAQPIPTTPANSSDMNEACVISPKWDEKSISQQYGECTVGGLVYSSQITPLAAEKVGMYLCDVTMTGYDIYEDKTYTIAAQVYTITDILQDCAVAVRFADTDEYYVYVNSWYVPQTLGDLIDALQLRQTLSFGEAYAYHYASDYHTTITYADFDDSLVWSLLLDDPSVKNEPDCDTFGEPKLHISVDIPLLGYKNISLGISQDGYVTTNILNTFKCFYVGAEKAQAFLNTITQNCTFTEERIRVVYGTGIQTELPAESESVVTSEVFTLSQANTSYQPAR